MIDELFVKEVLKAFVTLFVIMDPVGILPIFIGLVKGMPKKVMRRQTNAALSVAAVLLGLFIFFGFKILGFFGLDITSIKIAGGIILLIMGVFYVLGIGKHYRKESVNDITIPISTPLLVGPGVITTVIILVGENGIVSTLIAAILTIVVTAIIFNLSGKIYKVLGEQWTNIISRIMGLIIATFAVEFIRDGVVEVIRSL